MGFHTVFLFFLFVALSYFVWDWFLIGAIVLLPALYRLCTGEYGHSPKSCPKCGSRRYKAVKREKSPLLPWQSPLPRLMTFTKIIFDCECLDCGHRWVKKDKETT